MGQAVSVHHGKMHHSMHIHGKNRRGLARDLSIRIILYDREATVQFHAEPYKCAMAMVDAVLCHQDLLPFPEDTMPKHINDLSVGLPKLPWCLAFDCSRKEESLSESKSRRR